VSNGNIIKDNVEAESTANKVLTDEARHSLTLSDKLRGVELSNNRFENFINDGRKDTLVIVLTKGAIDGGKLVYSRLRKHTAGNVDHLKI
jgi:hypothetical protein